jgi:hypothetical protein
MACEDSVGNCRCVFAEVKFWMAVALVVSLVSVHPVMEQHTSIFTTIAVGPFAVSEIPLKDNGASLDIQNRFSHLPLPPRSVSHELRRDDAFGAPSEATPYAVFYNMYLPPHPAQYSMAVSIVLEQFHQIACSDLNPQRNEICASRPANQTFESAFLFVYYNTITIKTTSQPSAIPFNTTWFERDICWQQFRLICVHLNHYENEGENAMDDDRNSDRGGNVSDHDDQVLYDERLTLQDLQNYCRTDTGPLLETAGTRFNATSEQPQRKVAIYLHNKGSLHAGKKQTVWRRYLTRAATDARCLQSLLYLSHRPKCHVCGLLFLTFPASMFSGNMFMARCDYVARLVPPFLDLNNSTMNDIASGGGLAAGSHPIQRGSAAASSFRQQIEEIGRVAREKSNDYLPDFALSSEKLLSLIHAAAGMNRIVDISDPATGPENLKATKAFRQYQLEEKIVQMRLQSSLSPRVMGFGRHAAAQWIGSHPDLLACHLSSNGMRLKNSSTLEKNMFWWVNHGQSEDAVSAPVSNVESRHSKHWLNYPSTSQETLLASLSLLTPHDDMLQWSLAPNRGASLLSTNPPAAVDNVVTTSTVSRSGLNRILHHDVRGRRYEYFLLLGRIHRWLTLYQAIPSQFESWVWTYFPDGDVWRDAAGRVVELYHRDVSQHGSDKAAWFLQALLHSVATSSNG